jgi:hypothetical protein
MSADPGSGAGSAPGPRADVSESPPYCRHLMTLEAVPDDELAPEVTGYWFLSRCICGHDIAAGPLAKTITAIGVHLVDADLTAEPMRLLVPVNEEEDRW